MSGVLKQENHDEIISGNPHSVTKADVGLSDVENDAGKPTYAIGWGSAFREKFDARVTSDGLTITMSLEKAGGGDLTMIFSDGEAILDCTSPLQTIALTAGTDTVPVDNYVYIPQSTKVLTVSTSDFPHSAEHIKVAHIICQSAGEVQLTDPLKNQNWNNAPIEDNGNSHIAALAERLRQTDCEWADGVQATLTINAVSDPDDLTVSTTSGNAYQLHRQSFPAMDTATGDVLNIVNHPTLPLKKTANLNTELTDALGNSLSGKYYTLVLWGVQNKSGEGQRLMINLPTDGYFNQSDAAADSHSHSVFSIPKQYASVGFLIASFVLKHDTAAGGTWTLVATNDLRGKKPLNAAVPSITPELADFINIDQPNTFNNFKVMTVASNANSELSFNIPSNAGTITGIFLRCIIESGAAAVDRDIDFNAEYGGVGEAFNAGTVSDTTTIYDLSGKANQFYEFDLTALLSVVSANDSVGLAVDHNSIGGDINYLGIRITYKV